MIDDYGTVADRERAMAWRRDWYGCEGDYTALVKAFREHRLAASAEAADALAEAREAIINSPETADFMAGVPIEAAHQRERWGATHDVGKTPFDWFWLVGYLAQKAASSAVAGDTEKAMHHTISTAAALANWHAALSCKSHAMRPGIEPPAALSEVTTDRDEYECANCGGMFGELAAGRDPEELCDTCYSHATEALVAPPATYAPPGLKYAAVSQDDVWLLRFTDTDCGDQWFGGEGYDEGEGREMAIEAWNRYAPAWSVRLMRTVTLDEVRGHDDAATITVLRQRVAELEATLDRIRAAIGFVEPRDTASQQAEIANDLRAGMSLRKAAEKHGTNVGVVRGIARRINRHDV